MFKIFKNFFNFCGGENKRKFYVSLILGLVLAIFEALRVPAIFVMVDAVVNDNVTIETVIICFSIMALSVVAASIVRYKVTMLQTEGGYRTCSGKRIEIAEHLRYLPMGFFNQNSLGQITTVTTNKMEQLANVATRVVMMTTQGIINTIMITIMICLFDIRIGGMAIAGIIVFFMINSIMQRVAAKMAPVKNESDTTLVEKVIEYVQGISEVKAYNLSGKHSRELYKAIDNNSVCNFVIELKVIPFITLQSFIAKAIGVLMCAMSILFFIDGSMVLSECIVMMVSAFIMYTSLDNAGMFSSLLRVVDFVVEKAKEILNLEAMDIEGKDIGPKNYDIDVENVSFSYDKKTIINNLSVHIPEKTTTAIVGPSGGGKTTLCHLIARFWDVDKGRVLLGGKDVKEYSMDSLMKNFSFVFQNVYLFQDTIANNIRFGQPNAPMEQVVEAAKKACCHDFIMQLPEGYNTVIGEGGASLSGGEKQRISIARAIMKDAPIIILDEATANVDPENEKDLVEAIDALTKEKTILMIAHRLKTVRNADQILVVDKGQIVQQGNHKELMKHDGIYKRFVNAREIAGSWKLGA
ncbi:MAG: ABC transporter ATP-binding protein [Lachnospiraceae bacterium]|nr:ABC transporter ATP-binding protein [Lachnospiraceae bacterium]